MRSGDRTILIALALCAGAFSAPVQSASGQSLTPGAVALLVAQPTDEETQGLLRQALRDSDRDVRAAAARVVHASGATDLLADVGVALESEEDTSAAAEMLRALIVLGFDVDEAVLWRLIESGGEPAAAAADALGRTRGRSAPLLDVIRSGDALETFLNASAWDAAAVNVVATAVLRGGDVDQWNTLLSWCRVDLGSRRLGDGVLYASLTHSVAHLRVASLWFAVNLVLDGGDLGPVTRQAMASAPDDPALRGEEAFARAVLARLMDPTREGPGDEWAAWLASEPDNEVLERIAAQGVRAALTGPERVTVGRRVNDDRSPLTALDPTSRTPVEAALDDRRYPRTLEGYPPGFIADVLRAAGCQPAAEESLVAVVSYSRRGRPVQLTLPAVFDAEWPCHLASQVLLITGVARVGADVRPERPEIVVVTLTPAFVECVTSRPAAASEPTEPEEPGSGTIRAPTKVRDVRPVYPASAVTERLEGIVILEAIISTTGCVKSIRTLRNPDDRLTAAGIVAVSQWAYTPTLLHGEPVEVIMTVTVNFAMR